MVAVSKGNKIAELYIFQTLDGLVELIEIVSGDFRRHKFDRYRCLDLDVAAQLKSFDKVGVEVNYPNKLTRSRYFDAYLGDQLSANAHPFLEYAKSLRKSAARYVELEKMDPTGAGHCLGCVRLAAKRLFRVYLQLAIGTGAQFTKTHSRAGAVFRLTTDILRNKSFAAAFGVNEIGDEHWPESGYSRRGGMLVRQIMAICNLSISERGRITDAGRDQLEHLKAFQDCAFHGARTIQLVSRKNWNLGVDDHLAELATTAAQWDSAIRGLPHKVDRYRFTAADVARITGGTSHLHF